MAKREVITAKDVHPTIGYSQAWKCGDTIYVAGQVAMDVDRNIVGPGDFVKQCDQVFENIRRVLAAAGATMDDVVKLTTFVLDIENVPALREARARHLKTPEPAGTLLVVKSLASPDYLIEIEAIAVVES